jgi:hypothetical protein
MHIMFSLCLTLDWLSLACCVLWIPVFPSHFWDSVSALLRRIGLLSEQPTIFFYFDHRRPAAVRLASRVALWAALLHSPVELRRARLSTQFDVVGKSFSVGEEMSVGEDASGDTDALHARRGWIMLNAKKRVLNNIEIAEEVRNEAWSDMQYKYTLLSTFALGIN